MAIETLNPATGELLRTFPETSPAEVDRVLSAAVRAQQAWARSSFAERAAPMRRVGALFGDVADFRKIQAEAAEGARAGA